MKKGAVNKHSPIDEQSIPLFQQRCIGYLLQAVCSCHRLDLPVGIFLKVASMRFRRFCIFSIPFV